MFYVMGLVLFVSAFELYIDRTKVGFVAGVRFRWYRQANEALAQLWSSKPAPSEPARVQAQTPAAVVRNGEPQQEEESIPI